ncbi:MAG TPA: DUF1453 domain-containing protein [Mycobacteriales bacterium]|jgi:hypothetical protein|nr:DUF1453 domain-containing protein [Mycobacteriales bacterium]
MSPFDLLIILALVGYAIYRQTRRNKIEPRSRFKLTIIYAVIGIAVGGFAAPTSAAAVALLVTSLLLSLVVGAVRARYTQVWLEGRLAWSQGTALTVGLFLGLVAVKFILGAVADLTHVTGTGGLGEVMVMIAVMLGVQAELVWRRARRLLAASSPFPAAVRG